MKDSKPKLLSKNIAHMFSNEGEQYIGKEHWDKVDLLFSELHCNPPHRTFMFVIRYFNRDSMPFKLTQFHVKDEDELRQIYNTIGEVLNNPPKFNDTINE